MKYRRGFTLIEVLIVVSVIGALSSVVMTETSAARAKARNVQRLSDVQQLTNAFSIARIDKPLPTTGVPGDFACISINCGFIQNNLAVDSYLAPYISKPNAPESDLIYSQGYYYTDTYPGSTSFYDGYVFPPGPYIYWSTEYPVNPHSCGQGHIEQANDFLLTYVTPNIHYQYITCLYGL